jgi:hypothetical protein
MANEFPECCWATGTPGSIIHRETYFFQCHRRVELRHSLRDEANGDKVLEINALSSAQQCFREFGNLKEKEIPTLS